MTLDKAYNPQDVEDKWYARWEKENRFRADESSKKDPYCIVIPPPNVTGVLTMGHVLNNTLQDILARRKRMEGFEVLWLPGTDHAGIATQTVVEKYLKKEGKIKHRDDLGLEEFLKKTWEWRDKHGGIIIQQLKKLGCSCDWSRLVFTMDGVDEREKSPRINYSQCVRKVFVDLYNKGLIYRGRRMVNWCPVSQTALSDEEVEMKEVNSHLWHFKYPMLDEKNNPVEGKFIVVATTRPETMLGDEAVAVNPKDKRYKNLIGQMVLLPLQNKPIPIIADEAVDLEFGTGAVKVTPAHDPVDYEMGLRHKLPVTVVIAKDGRMTELAGEKYEGLDRFECRKAVVNDLEKWGFLLKVENYKHNVGYSQRADVPVESHLSEQWFLKYPKKEKSLKAVLNGEIKFWPKRWTKVFEHWMENLRDWCISRQLWWGHRIPVWYCHSCPPIVSLEAPVKCPKCSSTDLKQDEDVLDTWFSSWLWPFATLGWPEKTRDFEKFYPTSDLVTGPDIIFFWVARMIMAGYEFAGDKPFSNVYFTGIIRDSLGRKMSKSLGNSPDPLDLIAKYGADGLRFGLMLIAPKGQDILFAEERIETGRNFCNKLWNAARFTMMNLENVIPAKAGIQKSSQSLDPRFRGDDNSTLNPSDKWIINRLEHTIKGINLSLDRYEFDQAARILYQFVWKEFCDWYVELSKVHLYGENAESKAAACHTLKSVLTSTLKLLHPYTPFITEEIWQQLGNNETIMTAEFPKLSKKILYERESKEIERIQGVIDAVRNIRGEHNLKPKEQIDLTICVKNDSDKKLIERNLYYIEALTFAKEITISKKHIKMDDVATALVDGFEIMVPWKGLIDVEAEKTRLNKEISRVENEVESVGKKLQNESFVTRAPTEVVEKERARLTDAKEKLNKLKEAYGSLETTHKTSAR